MSTGEIVMGYETTTHPGSIRATEIHDDLCLVERALAGDQDALVSIMRQHNQRLYRLAVAIVSDKAEAEDVLQEAYLRAFGRMVDYSGDGHLGAWLASIVRNQAIDRLRVRKRRREHLAFEADMRMRSNEEQAPLSRARADEVLSNPELQAERNDMLRLLEREIARLPDRFREVFMLREVEGLSVEETAKYLSVPEATVKSRDFRARAILKTKLGAQIDATLPQTFTFLNQECAALVASVLKRLPQ